MSLEWIGIIISWIGTAIALYQIREIRRTRKRQESPLFEFSNLLIRRRFWANAKGKDVHGFVNSSRDQTVSDSV